VDKRRLLEGRSGGIYLQQNSKGSRLHVKVDGAARHDVNSFSFREVMLTFIWKLSKAFSARVYRRRDGCLAMTRSE
jgi:hypothetical protein